MRLRPPSIRTQLVTLLLVPSLSLAYLWMYSTCSSVNDALRLIRAVGVYRYCGTVPGQ
ncbi:hypothetical protein [Actinacidiphila oryziradicis]|uniref:hypothetical protein n=1 Tax=Actinacidiphila oryziradicis TaxID=2571141 RepID=UPI0023F20C3A|nr:hypothetical protein [Actinacidiphila oryziradicis]MCW2871535.1 Signal transduction histidine kinase [Actinacidiphila oryziradicis]